MFRQTWEAMANPDVLKIGIQVRIGDKVFSNQNLSNANDEAAWASVAPFFKCADEIAKTRARPGQPVLYYLISDSIGLRRLAKTKLGDKLLTDVDTPSEHVACIGGGSCDTGEQVSALRRAVGDLISFSMANYHVYTKSSGFGRLGSWMSFAWHHQYAIDGSARDCGMEMYDDLRHDARTWSGVRR